MIPMDLHTHSVASGHGTVQTIADLAKSACSKGITVLGISDHGPATPGSCRESYFRSLKAAPKQRAGIRVLYGAEANILDESGRLDLSASVMEGLDYIIASIHAPTFKSGAYCQRSFWDRRQTAPHREAALRSSTAAYISAMSCPYVKVLGHPDDEHYPVNCEELVRAAVEYRVILEINESSLSPDGYRGNAAPIMRRLLELCLERRHPVLLSSDSHGSARLGQVPLGESLIRELQYPRELIFNYQPPEVFLNFRP